jgi:hypothetical protein
MTGGMAIGLVGLVPQTAEASVQQNSRVVNDSESKTLKITSGKGRSVLY